MAARNAAAATKRAQNTQAAITDGLAGMEAWIADQLRTGLSELLAEMTVRCRRIASRLVDAKAGALAGRIDGIPSRVLERTQKDRPDALISELGKLVILARAWGDGKTASAAVRRAIVGAENRETLLNDTDAPRHSGLWEVLSSRDETRRDGLIARDTWLLGLDPTGPRFALLQDVFPASLGKQGAAFVLGEQFEADLVFYPSPRPMRAHIVDRKRTEIYHDWPNVTASEDVLQGVSQALIAEPWLTELPILLPEGRLGQTKEAYIWTGQEAALPLAASRMGAPVLGVSLRQSFVLWNGQAAHLLAADTSMGKYHADVE